MVLAAATLTACAVKAAVAPAAAHPALFAQLCQLFLKAYVVELATIAATATGVGVGWLSRKAARRLRERKRQAWVYDGAAGAYVPPDAS